MITESITIVEDITKEINERKAKIENKSQCLQIQEALTGLKDPIVGEGDRQFLEEFIFIKKGIQHQRIFFVSVQLYPLLSVLCIHSVLCCLYIESESVL